MLSNAEINPQEELQKLGPEKQNTLNQAEALPLGQTDLNLKLKQNTLRHAEVSPAE